MNEPTYIVYILYSKQLNRFYTGSTSLTVEQRLYQHIKMHFGNSKYTALANDWEIFLTINCISREQAKRLETHIKKMKSKIYIQNLWKYPEMIEKLLLRF